MTWYFGNPWALWWLLAIPVACGLLYYAQRQRQKTLSALGDAAVLGQFITIPRRRRRISQWCLILGLTSLCLALANPRWGKGDQEGVLVGRDIVLIYDLSRSMEAADMSDASMPTRWQAAQQGMHRLLNAVQARGGNRLALVVVAAKAYVVCPLTSDYDYLRTRIDEYSPSLPPPEVRPQPDEPIESGTRLGWGIQLAVEAHEPQFIGYQDIVLLSDGDGPAVEREIETGIRAASNANIPVHTVGIGDPTRPFELVLGTGNNADFVGTTMQADLLRDVARRTNGEYLASERETPPLDTWYQQVLANRPSRELDEDAIPKPKDRTVWFCVLALMLLFLGWMLEK
ncbi:MAG: VWA domain-containing protein [Zavarzinella sp.]